MDHVPSSSTDGEPLAAVDVNALAAEVAALRDRLAATEAELEALCAPAPAHERPPSERASAAASEPPAEQADGPLGRRHLLKAGLAAAGAAAAGAALLDAQPAAAADGSTLTIGQYNTGATGTRLNITSDGVANGLTILDHDNVNVLNAGLSVQARSQAFSVGASISSLNGTAITASSGSGTAINVLANSGTAIIASSTSGPGMSVSSKQYQLRLNLSGSTRPAPTADAILHRVGELVRDAAGDLWLSAVEGTPGTWRKLGGPRTAGALHLLDTPVRVYDSRAGTSPAVGSKTKLGANVNRAVDLTANSSSVPADALGVMCNLLLVDATSGNGNFTIWANGAPRPQANTLVWGGSAGRFSTLALTKVDATGKAQVNASAPTNIVVDIVGYYR